MNKLLAWVRLNFNFSMWLIWLQNCFCRFNGLDFLEKYRGKKIMFVGDSLSLNQFNSLACMIHAWVPKSRTTFSQRDALSSVTFEVGFLFFSKCYFFWFLDKWFFFKFREACIYHHPHKYTSISIFTHSLFHHSKTHFLFFPRLWNLYNERCEENDFILFFKLCYPCKSCQFLFLL